MGKEVVRDSKEWLPRKLSPQELYDAGKKLADALRRIAEAEGRMEAFKKQVNAEVQAAEADVNILRERISSETVYENVPVKIHFNFKAGKKMAVRVDTGEQVWERDVTEEERQLELKEQAE